MKVTREQVVDTIQQCLETVRLWEASGSPHVNWRSGVVQAISDQVAQSIDQVCYLCQARDADDDAKELILAIDRFQGEVHAWREAIDLTPESVHPGGNAQMWSTLNVLEPMLEVKRTRLPEPIRELMDAKVSDEQICKIYGFVKADGSADVVKLAEERKTPGTHYDPETWESRSDKGRREQTQKEWAQRVPIEHFPIGNDPVEAKPRAIAPEPLDELIAQGVDGEQIARMKGMAVEDVEAYAAKRGLPLEGRFRPAKPEDHDEQAALNERRAKSYPDSHPEISDLEERVLECALDKMKVTDIAEALQTDHPGLTWQKVNAILAKLEKDGAEAAAAELSK